MNLTDLTALLADGIEKGVQAIRERPASSGRPPDDRRRYAVANDPHGYIRDILGCRLTPQQHQVVEAVMTHDRVLVPAANNVGKTHVIACLGWWFYDAVASLPDVERGLDEQGCILLLPGPDHKTIFDTIYRQMLDLADAAEKRGKTMPGSRSTKSPLMEVGPRWFVRAFSPRHQLGRGQAHTAAGRHHPNGNQVALAEEGSGLEEATWVSIEGMCSARGNRIVSPSNPTEKRGGFYDRSQRGDYYVIALSGLEHPNIIERRAAIPGAIDHHRFDERVRHQCDDRGPASSATPDPLHQDFVYALPAPGGDDGPRQDGIRGAAGGEPHVYRPGPVFSAQGLGQWPTTSSTGLFDPAAWDRSVERWKRTLEPQEAPDRVGVDAARTGDDTACAPAWGRPASELLAAWRSMQRTTARPVTRAEDGSKIPESIDDIAAYLERRAREAEETAVTVKSSAEEALARVQERNRVRIGRIEVAPKGTGGPVARWVAARFPESPFVVDDGGVGASVYDQLSDVLGRDAMPVSFGSAPLTEIPGELLAENLRTQMYLRAAELLRLDLLDLPPDPMLRQEAMAHRLDYRQKAVGTGRSRRVRSSVLLISKDEVKAEIGRSPDRMDAVVLSLMPLRIQRWHVG